MNAFDYESQEWIEGAASVPVHVAQILEELNILRSVDGERYATFCGGEFPDKEAMIARLELELAGLEERL